jgi:carboxylate-amine ligase
MRIPFASSQRSTVGIEWELALVDARSGELRQSAPTVLDAVRPPSGKHPAITAELLTNTIEITSGVCDTVAAAGQDMDAALAEVRAITDPLGVEVMSAGTHPFARWNDQQVTPSPRYATLLDRTQWWGRQMMIYGVHVHIGVEDRAKVLPILNAMTCSLPALQALSASSPFWEAQDTGYASQRALLFQQLPTAGLPFVFESWAELESYAADLLRTGVIEDFTEVRWDVRPAPRFGTLEVRICDGISNRTELLAMAAFTHCLVEHFSARLDEGRELPSLPPWYAQENKWRAARYGMEAVLIVDRAGNEELVTDVVRRLVKELTPVAEQLGCMSELADIDVILRHGASYQRQRAVARRHGGALDAVVASLVAEMRAGHPL